MVRLLLKPEAPEVGFSADNPPVFNTNNVKEIENVGKFEVDIDGNITFTPVKTFVGKHQEIEVSRADVNGKFSCKTKYQVTVTVVKPSGVETRQKACKAVQEGRVTFTPGRHPIPENSTRC